jgi:hypothetical protein
MPVNRTAGLMLRRLGFGIAVERVMSDCPKGTPRVNGNACRSHLVRQRITSTGLTHIRTRPYTSCMNGKAERFIQTLVCEWAYVRTYQTSADRADAMHFWINTNNHHRPLNGKSPASHLNNLLGNDSWRAPATGVRRRQIPSAARGGRSPRRRSSGCA